MLLIPDKKWNYKKSLLVVLTISWITGLAFFILNTFVTFEGEFGIEKHPWQYPILRIHGAASFFIMIIFGYFLAAHVKINWRRKEKPILGIIMVAMPILSIISAYILYYFALENFREFVGYFHFFTGLSIPFILIAHILTMNKPAK